jgi:ATP-dependent Clp protease adaptor protein ClpS
MEPMPDLLHNLRPPSGISAKPQDQEFADIDVLTDYDNPFSLIVWNDEVNTFEWVIIHTKGKYAVKRGSYDELKPLCDAITDRGIGATIEILSES